MCMSYWTTELMGFANPSTKVWWDSIEQLNWTERVCMLLVSLVFKCFMLFCLRVCWCSWGFVTPRASWGSWKALGEVWGLSGAPRIGFGTFWGDLGESLGGVQSSLSGGKYVTNTEVLELGRFSVTCRGLWILFVCSMLFWVWCFWIGEVNSL